MENKYITANIYRIGTYDFNIVSILLYWVYGIMLKGKGISEHTKLFHPNE